MHIHTQTYVACGNRVLIYHVTSADDLARLRSTRADLFTLARTAIKQHTDSVMVITGDPNQSDETGFHVTMDVFEPHAFFMNYISNAWSTMCGNGIRAVAQYLEEYYGIQDNCVIRSKAGDQIVQRLGQNWKVHMGNFYTSAEHLQKYIVPDFLPSDLTNKISSRTIDSQFYTGFHAQQSTQLPDGEPHLVLFENQANDLISLKRTAEILGPLLTQHIGWFPLEINTNIAVIHTVNQEQCMVELSLATYERNIYYVTQACGTGATAVAASTMKRLDLNGDWKFRIHTLGGLLTVDVAADEFWLSGDAQKV